MMTMKFTIVVGNTNNRMARGGNKIHVKNFFSLFEKCCIYFHYFFCFLYVIFAQIVFFLSFCYFIIIIFFSRELNKYQLDKHLSLVYMQCDLHLLVFCFIITLKSIIFIYLCVLYFFYYNLPTYSLDEMLRFMFFFLKLYYVINVCR